MSERCSLVSLKSTLSQRRSDVINVVGHQSYQKVVIIRFVDVVLKRRQNFIFITQNVCYESGQNGLKCILLDSRVIFRQLCKIKSLFKNGL